MKDNQYTTELLGIMKSVTEGKQSDFINRFTTQAKNPTAVFGFSVFLGSLGIDRFLVGQPLFGILKLLTGGGAGIWYIIDLFIIGSKVRQNNLDLARQIASSV